MASINTNLLSLTGQTNLKRSQSALATSMERLSSGLRINGAKDDAAGQAIANRMTSQISGRAMAMRNANDGVSLAQTAHGALDQINDKLQRVRELTVQGLNGTLSWDDNDAIQSEINMNLREIDRLADSVDYNGIPLLNGRGGLVNLQVGANDNQTLGVDLLPPGFSVAALGLEDFTVAGIDGEVTPRNTLAGVARDIELYPQGVAQTSVSYTGVTGSEPTLRLNGSSYYISTLNNDAKPQLYSAVPQAHHDTTTDSSEVEVRSTGLLYTASLTNVAERAISSISFTDSSGDAFTGSSRLIESDGRYLIEHTVAEGVRYYEASLEFAPRASSVNVSAVSSLPVSEQTYNAVTELDVDGTNYSLGMVDELIFQGSSGQTLPNAQVRINDGRYYIQSELAGETVYYRLDTTSALTEEVDGIEETTLTLQADTSRAFLSDDFADANNVAALPAVDFASSPTINITNADDEAINASARLMQRAANGQYMVEVEDGAGIYRYYQADVSVSVGTDGTVEVNAKAQANISASYNLNERVETVAGSSTVTLDPRNVTVNYTDANGDRFSNVLNQRADGNYYFDLPNSQSSYGSYKVASLVDVDGNDTLIKTINGAGEVIIYYPLDSLNPLSINVSTDANGADDDGTPHTVVNLTEVDREIRLRTPPNPLAALDRAIAIVDSKRSHLGAIENRLGSVVENHLVGNINLSAARSHIEDADYAVEVANMTRAQILQQAGTSVLAQANQTPQNVLSLLG